MYITRQNIFLIPDDAVARNLVIIFNFSSQRPYLNYIFLSNFYSFDTMEFLFIFTNKASSHVVIGGFHPVSGDTNNNGEMNKERSFVYRPPAWRRHDVT